MSPCFKSRASAAVMAEANANWVEYKLTPASAVQVKCVGEPAVALPAGTMTMEAALQSLGRAGQVRVKILNHSSERVGDTSSYKVELGQVCAMSLDPPAGATYKEATWDKVALHVPLRQLCRQGVHGVPEASGVCRLVHHLQYLPRGKELQPYYPCVRLRQNSKLGPHQVVRLTVAGVPGVTNLAG